MSANRPLDLVVANYMHDLAGATEKLDQLLALMMKDGASSAERTAKVAEITGHTDWHEAIIRKMLCEIAHCCPLPVVQAALSAVKAPSTVADFKEGLQAVRDRQMTAAKP
jgi:hypothetical protein